MVKDVSCQWLSQMVAASSNELLLLDTRSAEMYATGFINGSLNICCSGVILRRLRNGTLKIDSLLNCEEDKVKYAAACQSESISVVVCDQNTPSSTHLQQDSIAALLLRKLSKECKFVAFLAGGFDAFHTHHGELCELPISASDSVLKKRPSSLVLQLTNLGLNSSKQEQVSENESSPEVSPEYTAPFQILPHLYLGCRKVASCLPGLRANAINRILNVTSSIPNQFKDLGGFTYKQIPVEDSHEVDMIERLPDAFAFIEEARLQGEKVLVHCHAGMSRSVTVIIAYLMKYYQHTLDSAYEFVKQKKSNISPNFSFMGQLLEYEALLRPCATSTSPAESGYGSSHASPLDGHSYFLPSPVGFSRSCVLAA